VNLGSAMDRRVDPEDGVLRTLDELIDKCVGTYNINEIQAYWHDECKPPSAPNHQATLAPSGVPGQSGVPGLRDWLEERDLGQFLEHVVAWCTENGAANLDEVEENFEEIKARILASEIEPGEKVRVRVLQGKWKGQYVAEVLGTDIEGIRLRHVEDDFVETLPWKLLGGKKYCMEPLSDEEDDEQQSHGSVSKLLWIGRLQVDPAGGAGLELRWVKMGYCVDSIEPQPGQPDLNAGDAIVAIGGKLLAGLSEDEVEQVFGESFGDGVGLVVGPLAQLLQHTVEQVRCNVQQLLADVKK